MAKLWGTRFEKGLDPSVLKFTSSIKYDKRLAVYDIKGSIAHARMLGKKRIIPPGDAKKLISGLNTLLKGVEKGKIKFNRSTHEDIHSAIIDLLEKRIGKVAKERLHTARSRNDQVNLDVRLYCKDKIDKMAGLIRDLQRSLVKFSKENIDVIIPAYTHLQHAQCVLMAHQMLAFVEMLQRDKERLISARLRVDEMPLGSCALRGTSLPIDRKTVARELGFSKVSANSIDSISDRDFIMEILSCLVILGIHLSRFAEDMILYSTREFAFVEIDDSLATGSSMMPNKKNPDVLELIRGLSGKIYANLSSVTVMMKGLPLSYNRDLQLDKVPLFSSIETLEEVLPLVSMLIESLKVNKDNIRKKIMDSEMLFATDIAEYLVKKGHSYREAHDITGKLIKYSVKEDINITDIPQVKLKAFSSKLSCDAVKALMDPEESVSSIKSFGGTNPKMVRDTINRWMERLKHA